jgi:hypothetical protein
MWKQKRERHNAVKKRRQHFLRLAALEYRHTQELSIYTVIARTKGIAVEGTYGWDTAYFRAFKSGKVDQVGTILYSRRCLMYEEAQALFITDLIGAWKRASDNVPEYVCNT